MNPIKRFFQQKKTNRNFKSAGQGHKLSDTFESRNVPRQSSENQGPSSHHQMSEGAQRAGAAAIARIEQKQQPVVNWSLQATRAKARKELELENAAKQKLSNSPVEVIQDSCPVLSVSGVYFTCPMIGPDILPRPEIEAKIKEFLYEQLEQEKGLTACLIIHTCNKNKEKVRIGIETLSRYFTNIMDDPTQEKYRKIRLMNKVFQERVADLEGAFELLGAAGFEKQVLKEGDKEEEYFVFPVECLEKLENLEMLKEALLSAEPILPDLDRNLRVLKLLQGAEKVNLPQEFFHLSTEEMKREIEAKAEVVELSQQLRTKAMRERDEIREIHMYKYTLIRIRFPNGIILQGTFHVNEKLLAVKEFVQNHLSDPSQTFSLLAPGSFKLIDDNSSLLELKLVPACILNFHWESSSNSYLNEEVLALLENA